MESYEKYVGQVFDKRYRIIKVIGIGGMAVVFEANDLLMRRNVAVKMLKDEINNDTQSVKRFINESKAVAMLSHPNIVNIYDVSVKDNLKYIVMELVEGVTLKNYILKKGTLSYHEVISITEQILLALEHAHSKGIVHRDIKPQNIMMLKNGVIKVADFGIAKLPNAETVTMTDKAIGTVFYISPEQASGRTIDRRSDIYSLGVTMYEMATGKLPFVADSPVTVAIMQVKNDPKPPREVNPNMPIGLEQIIIGAMEKNPDNRFQSASQMLRHIAQLKNNPHTVFKVPKSNDASAQTNQGETKQELPSNVRKLTPPKSSRSMFPVIAGVATAFLIVCCISAVVVLSRLFEVTTTDNSKQITVPGLVGTIYSNELKTQLESQYYTVEVNYIYDSSYNRDEIISQDPVEGEKRKVIPDKQRCELKLTVSYGAATIELEDYSYKDSREVKIELTNLGIAVEIKRETHEYLGEGQVIRTDPAPGTVLRRGDGGDKVILYVSSGQDIKYINMPDFTNCDEEAVMKMLGWNDLKLGEVTYEYSDKVIAGRVIRQSHATSAQTPVGTAVDFVMSLGPKPSDTTPPDTDTDDSSGVEE
ncbi:MAG: Stk1 family PASTA domain-containing Ser/Thr kinase [Clostridiales bacterium]|nr:Stk1 family PASTA domain-containing Ser/Thr kinase [Clostridiales bacterium]